VKWLARWSASRLGFQTKQASVVERVGSRWIRLGRWRGHRYRTGLNKHDKQRIQSNPGSSSVSMTAPGRTGTTQLNLDSQAGPVAAKQQGSLELGTVCSVCGVGAGRSVVDAADVVIVRQLRSLQCEWRDKSVLPYGAVTKVAEFLKPRTKKIELGARRQTDDGLLLNT